MGRWVEGREGPGRCRRAPPPEGGDSLNPSAGPSALPKPSPVQSGAADNCPPVAGVSALSLSLAQPPWQFPSPVPTPAISAPSWASRVWRSKTVPRSPCRRSCRAGEPKRKSRSASSGKSSRLWPGRAGAPWSTVSASGRRGSGFPGPFSASLQAFFGVGFLESFLSLRP